MANNSIAQTLAKLPYCRYLELLNKAVKTAKMPELAAMDAVMLNAVGCANARGVPFQVLQAMTACKEISTTTAHRILKRLRSDGWLELKLDEVDNRIKYTLPSKQAEKYFALHSQCMTKALEEADA